MEDRTEMLLKEPPAKVRLIYRAVYELMSEDCDMNNVRVSEITARAGIGKGTAYEYFQDKDEMVSYAIFYNMLREIGELRTVVLGQDTFRGKVYCILDNVEQNFAKRRDWFHYLDFYLHSMVTKQKTADKIFKCRDLYEKVKAFAENVSGQALKEKLILEAPNVFFLLHAFGTQLLGYVYYLEHRQLLETISMEEMKAFTYQSILKMIGGHGDSRN